MSLGRFHASLSDLCVLFSLYLCIFVQAHCENKSNNCDSVTEELRRLSPTNLGLWFSRSLSARRSFSPARQSNGNYCNLFLLFRFALIMRTQEQVILVERTPVRALRSGAARFSDIEIRRIFVRSILFIAFPGTRRSPSAKTFATFCRARSRLSHWNPMLDSYRRELIPQRKHINIFQQLLLVSNDMCVGVTRISLSLIFILISIRMRALNSFLCPQKEKHSSPNATSQCLYLSFRFIKFSVRKIVNSRASEWGERGGKRDAFSARGERERGKSVSISFSPLATARTNAKLFFFLPVIFAAPAIIKNNRRNRRGRRMNIR